MAIIPIPVTVTAVASEFNADLKTAMDALTITNIYGFSITTQGGNITGTFLYK